MTDHDKELGYLYQQRKQSFPAPEINVEKLTKKERKPSKFAGVAIALFGGGCASFMVLALMSYLATSPVEQVPASHNKQPTNTIELTDNSQDIIVNAVEKELDKINRQLPIIDDVPIYAPYRLAPDKPDLLDGEKVLESLNITAQYKDTNNGEIRNLAYRVLPVFPDTLLTQKHLGNVHLSFRLTEQGEVTDIQVLNSSTHQSLTDSSIQAVSKWRYQKNKAVDKIQVIFKYQYIKQ